MQDVINYYNISKVLTFNKINYNLIWSSNANVNYYKQEYVPKGESVERYNDLILIDFVNKDITLTDVVYAQIANLIERKKTDEVCNYKLIKSEKNNEYILDFIMSESENQNIKIIEWNAYHYKLYTDKKGHSGVLLFGASHRAYDEKSSTFLGNLKNYRLDILKKLGSYQMPEIQLN
jgi:hypothetical protein